MNNPPITIGAFEAKTHLSDLLRKASEGQEYLITNRGQPVARLVPLATPKQAKTTDLVQRFADLRKQFKHGGLSWEEIKVLRDEGRKGV